ncbi:acyl-CoA carboxylase epsilon subunit [Subtercola sp. YIM 133946]|uniref:acyl-CoA carboxylase epsilon subunit n=1 Tax=Subtercola sp. YIM 133946 TaxID=3118909 RepID=UPI002F92E83B
MTDETSADEPVVVTTTNVTATELAAVSAVVRGMLLEEHDSLRVERPAGQSRWQRSQRDLRTELNPAVRTWQG